MKWLVLALLLCAWVRQADRDDTLGVAFIALAGALLVVFY